MGRGSLQLRHRKRCAAKGRDARKCTCGPTVYAVLANEWSLIGHLVEGWRRDDLREFEEELADMRRKRRAGEPYRPVEPKLLHEWAGEWFADLRTSAEAGDVSKLTFNTYRGHYRNHLEPEFGERPLASITSEMVRRFIRAKVAAGLSPRTANALITPLSAMLTDARDVGLIASNPCQQPRRARHGASRRRALLAEVKSDKPKHLEPTEARALLAATPDRYRDMILAALATGFRRGELLGLGWEDVDFGAGRIELRRQLQGREAVKPKYSSYREVPLYSGLRAALARRRGAEGYVFTGPDGRPWGDSEPDRVFLAAAYETAGLRRAGVLWHSLRHTYASILAAGDIREDVVGELMGHKRQGTTALYSHLFANAYEGVEQALDSVLGVNGTSTEGRVTEEPSADLDSTRSGESRMVSGVPGA